MSLEPDSAFAIGRILHDTYRIEALIGEGGMGAVFRASHVRLPKPFAVKVLRPEVLGRSGASYGRFRREAEIASSLGHPNIVEVYDFNTQDGQPYLVMELLEGENLRELLEREGALTLGRTLELLRPIASALEATHARGIIHRDLKPQNLFIARKGGHEVVKVLDFGISKISDGADLRTHSAALLGTPGYMSPEQARGEHARLDARSDQFSLGAIVYEMLSGRSAFLREGDTVYSTILRIVNDEPPKLGGLPEPVLAAVRRAMAKQPEQRFPSVAELVDALAAAAGDDARVRSSSAVVEDQRPLGTTMADSIDAAAVANQTPPPPARAPRRGRLGPLLTVAVLATVAMGAAVWPRLRPTVPPSHPPPPRTERPTPAPAAPPVAAPARPADVQIDLDLSPPTARVLLDGARLGSPHVRLHRGAPPPTLRVEAEGYRTIERPLPTDRDQRLAIRLAPARPRHPAHSGAAAADDLEDPYAAPRHR